MSKDAKKDAGINYDKFTWKEDDIDPADVRDPTDEEKAALLAALTPKKQESSTTT